MIPRGLNGSLETVGKNEGNESFFSSMEKKMPYILRFWVKMTLLPPLLQPNHCNAITQFKGQNALQLPRKGLNRTIGMKVNVKISSHD